MARMDRTLPPSTVVTPVAARGRRHMDIEGRVADDNFRAKRWHNWMAGTDENTPLRRWQRGHRRMDIGGRVMDDRFRASVDWTARASDIETGPHAKKDRTRHA